MRLLLLDPGSPASYFWGYACGYTEGERERTDTLYPLLIVIFILGSKPLAGNCQNIYVCSVGNLVVLSGLVLNT